MAGPGFRKISNSVTLYFDNHGSIVLSSNLEFHHFTKHIDMQFHWIREDVSIKQINIVYISKIEMAADSLTKSLPAFGFFEFCRIIVIDEGL